MAVFLAASDESDGGHHRSEFWHSGWLMPETDWHRYFVPAWQERVLDAKPTIPYLHMTEIRDPGWRMEHGITWDQAQEKLDTAAILIYQMGSLVPVTVGADAGEFLEAHGKKKIMQNPGEKKPVRFLIDHYCFNAYVFTVLNYIHVKHPEVEKVDFMVERKAGVSDKLEQFYDGLETSFDYLGLPELKKYLGKLQAVGKDRVPVQAADMLCWHISRADLGLLKGRDAKRGATIFHRRTGPIIELPDHLHFEVASAFMEKMNESRDGVPELRRHNEEVNPSTSRRDKVRTRSGKSRKNRKKAEG